jgi:hypothetical protein
MQFLYNRLSGYQLNFGNYQLAVRLLLSEL